MSSKDLYIRSSSAEFLIFERQTHASGGVEVRFEDGDLWLTQKSLGELFNTTRNNITMHLQDIYSSLELDEISTSKAFLQVQKEGNREVKRNVKYYNLDMIIAIGYSVNSDRAIQFRRWATNVLFVYNIDACNNYLNLEENTSLQKLIKQELLNGYKFYLRNGILK